jgi:hypothetical protein
LGLQETDGLLGLTGGGTELGAADEGTHPGLVAGLADLRQKLVEARGGLPKLELRDEPVDLFPGRLVRHGGGLLLGRWYREGREAHDANDDSEDESNGKA